MFVVQDGSCSDGGSGTPLSDRASLVCLDLHNLDSPDQGQGQGQGQDQVQDQGQGQDQDQDQDHDHDHDLDPDQNVQPQTQGSVAKQQAHISPSLSQD